MEEIDALLINPISARMIPAFLPHGLLYIAAYVINRGYKVRIYDRNTENLDVAQILRKVNPKVIGLGCLTGSTIDDAVNISKEIRRLNPSIKIVWGGIHTTLYPDSVLREDFVDFVIVGDGEYAFSGILDSLVNKKISLEMIDNLGYKLGSELKYNKRSFVDIDSLPLPAWHLIDTEKYVRHKFYAKRVISINTSRGCPYKCSFCCIPSVHLGKWRAMSAQKIIDNLKFLKNNYRIDGFQVDDDEFDIDRQRVLKLCDLLELNNFKLKWSHFSRINIVNEEVLRREIKSGLRLIEFGVESGSQRMLKFLNKGQTVEMIRKAYSLCNKLRLKTSALFMIGLPTETAGDLKETVSLIRDLKSYITLCTIYRPYPGSELFNYCISNNLFKYPEKLENVAKSYEALINTSNVADKVILKIKRHFDLNNIYQELKFIFTNMKIGLFFYYLFYYVIKPRKMAVK